MNFKQIALALIGASLIGNAHADLLGVSDAALLAKSMEQLNVLYKQLETVNKTYASAKDQFNATKSILSKAEAQLKSMDDLVKKNSGHYGFGNLQNAIADLHSQQWSPDNWQDALKGIGGKSDYQNLNHAYDKAHNILNTDEFKKGANDAVTLDYEQSVAVNKAASVQSEFAFNEINKSLKRIHELSTKIEHAENTKAAVDLNSRLLTELAYLQTQNLKSQSLINQQLAQKQALEISERGNVSKLLAFDDDY